MNSQIIRKIGAMMIASSILLTGCSISFNGNNINTIVGSDKPATETRAVNGVNAVSLTSSGSLIVEYGDTESLSVTADDNILPLLTSDVSNGRLSLGIKPVTSMDTRTPIVYRLTVKSLKAIVISGSGDATLLGMNVDTLNTTISGSGSVTTSGVVESQDVTVSGSGSYNGEKLNSRRTTVTCTGSGSSIVKVSDSLKVNISGSGSVEYIGNPQTVDKLVSGSGSVHQR